MGGVYDRCNDGCGVSEILEIMVGEGRRREIRGVLGCEWEARRRFGCERVWGFGGGVRSGTKRGILGSLGCDLSLGWVGVASQTQKFYVP